MDAEIARKYIEAKQAYAAAEEAKKLAAAEKDRLEVILLKEFEKDGMQSVNLHGYTLSLREESWSRIDPEVGEATMKRAFSRAKLGHLLKTAVNTQTFGAFVREAIADGRELPKPLQKLILTSNKFTLSMRKS